MSERIFLGLGSNVGDRDEALRLAAEGVAQLPGTRIVGRSRTVATPALRWPGDDLPQEDFRNAVIEVATQLSPDLLFDGVKALEVRLGRVPTRPWGPRRIDIDILLWGSRVVETARLSIPHPRMHERLFVLEPLCGLAPEFVHPRLGLSVKQLLSRLGV